MNKYKRLGKNIFLLLTGNFVTKILSFLMVPFYTSILTTSDYGTADLISTTVLLVLPFFSLLMDEAVMRFALDASKEKKQVFTIAMSVSTVGFLLAMFVSPIVLLFDSLRPYYWFVVLYYVSLWIYNIFSNYVKGLDKVSIITIAGIIHTFFYLGINILCLAVLKWGVYGYLLSISLSNLIAAIFLFFSCKLYRCFFSIKKIDYTLVKDMVKYSVPMIPDYISWWINNASDRYIIALFYGTSVTGIYSVAYKIPTLLNSLTSIFSSAWKISSVDNFGSEESINFYNRIYKLYSGFLLIAASGLILITKVLAKILFAKEFFLAWKITPILILAYVFSAQAIFLGSIFTASKKTKTLFFSSMAGAIVNVAFNFILIPWFEGTGAAIATTIGYFTILVMNMVLTGKILQMKFGIVKNSICWIMIVIEICAMLSDSMIGIVLAIACILCVILLNVKEFIILAQTLLLKLKKRIKLGD